MCFCRFLAFWTWSCGQVTAGSFTRRLRSTRFLPHPPPWRKAEPRDPNHVVRVPQHSHAPLKKSLMSHTDVEKSRSLAAPLSSFNVSKPSAHIHRLPAAPLTEQSWPKGHMCSGSGDSPLQLLLACCLTLTVTLQSAVFETLVFNVSSDCEGLYHYRLVTHWLQELFTLCLLLYYTVL